MGSPSAASLASYRSHHVGQSGLQAPAQDSIGLTTDRLADELGFTHTGDLGRTFESLFDL